MIICNNVCKSFSSEKETITIYNNLNRSLHTWESASIMWPSGSGKSTLLNLISWLDTVDSGKILVWEKDISQYTEDERTLRRWKNVWFIFQQFNLIANLTVEENIDLAVDISQIPRRYSTQEMLWKVGLSWYEKKYPSQLSGWEQQRVAIARGFIAKFPLLLADEPTGNLDHNNAYMIMDLMMKLQQESQTSIILITHDPKVAEYAQHKYELIDGNLLPK